MSDKMYTEGMDGIMRDDKFIVRVPYSENSCSSNVDDMNYNVIDGFTFFRIEITINRNRTILEFFRMTFLTNSDLILEHLM